MATCNTRFTRDDVIKIDLEETGWEGVDWMCLIRYGNTLGDLVNIMVNLWVLSNAGRFLTAEKLLAFQEDYAPRGQLYY